jgi:hypothetical protein
METYTQVDRHIINFNLIKERVDKYDGKITQNQNRRQYVL